MGSGGKTVMGFMSVGPLGVPLLLSFWTNLN